MRAIGSTRDGDAGTLITIAERSRDGDAMFSVRVGIGDGAHCDVGVSDPAGETDEARLGWYFEQHLRYPSLDRDKEQQAVRQIASYGEALFSQVFSGAAAGAYRSLRETSFAGCRLEVTGSAALHRLHWEALRDPDLSEPLGVLLPIIRRVAVNAPRLAPAPLRPTLNILVVTARPDGRRDVGYRTISRPLLDALEPLGLPVTVNLVRPGTWQALWEHVQSATECNGPGWYHVVHFDVHGMLSDYQTLEAAMFAGRVRFSAGPPEPFEGKRGFLFFETSRDGVTEPVTAAAVASLLTAHQIPVAVMNACQSAMQPASGASLAQRLTEAGVQVSVGMAYSVTVSAAVKAIPVLYSGLAEGTEPGAAVRQARHELYARPARDAYFNQRLDLQDWMLPVIFERQPVRIALREMTGTEQEEFRSREVGGAGGEPAVEYGFVGRDLDIHTIERRLLSGPGGNELLIHGIAGAGKSALIMHLAWWWQRTGLAERIFRFSYADQAWTTGQIADGVLSGLLGPAEIARVQTLPAGDRLAEAVRRLREGRYLLILDSAESITVERGTLKTFLGGLRGGRTLVLIGSSESETWLTSDSDPDSPGVRVHALLGLDTEAASAFVERILSRHQVSDYLQDPAERAALEDLITLLGGYPLPMRLVLPVLASVPPSTAVRELDSGGPAVDPDGLVRRSVAGSFERLDQATRNSLLLLAPFTSVIATGPVLAQYRDILLADESVKNLGPIDLAAALNEAGRVGLAIRDPRFTNVMQLQPLLPYFLRGQLHDRPALRAAVDQAHYLLYAELGAEIHRMLTSRDSPEQRAVGQTVTQGEYANLNAAVRHGLATGQPVSPFIEPLKEYLNQTRRHGTRRRLLEEAIAAYPVPVSPEQHADLASLHNYAGYTAREQHRYDDAKAHYEAELRLEQAVGDRRGQGYSYIQLGAIAEDRDRLEEAAENYDKALGIFDEFGIRDGVATVYHNLGSVRAQEGDDAAAEENYHKALAMKLRLGDQRSAVVTYRALGDLAQSRRQPEKAEANYRKALDIDLRFADKHSAAASYRGLGDLARERQQFDEAEANYRKALDIDLSFGDQHSAAPTYQKLGRLARSQGRFDEAEANYRKALNLDLSFSERLAAAGKYLDLALLAEEQREYADATHNYQTALGFFEAFGDEENIAATHYQLGKVARAQGQLDEAEASYRSALAIGLESGDHSRDTNLYYELGEIAADQRRFGEADDSYQEALEACLRLGEWGNAAVVYHKLGVLAEEQQRYAEAEENYRKDLELCLEHGEQRDVALAYDRLGVLRQERGRPAEAEEDFKLALDLYLRLGDKHDASRLYSNLGAAVQAQQRFDEANAFYRKALDIHLETGDQHAAAGTYHNLGVMAKDRHQYGAAEENHREALRRYLESGDQGKAADTHHQLGTIAEHQRRYTEAEEHYRSALAIDLESGNQVTMAETYRRLGMLLTRLGRCEEAEENYRKALENRPNSADTYHQLGMLAHEQRRLGEAEENYRKALEIDLESGNQDHAADTYHQLGALAQDQERLDEAEENYRKALEIDLITGNQDRAASTYLNLGGLAQLRSLDAEAEESIRKALGLFTQFADQNYVAAAYHNLGVLLAKQGRYDEAEDCYGTALNIFLKIDDPRMWTFTARRFYVALFKQGQHAQATRILLHAAVVWRQGSGEWLERDLQWLHLERSLLKPKEFAKLVKEEVSVEVANELMHVLEAAGDPGAPPE